MRRNQSRCFLSKRPLNVPKIPTAHGVELEMVMTSKYQGMVVDGNVSFKSRKEKVVSELKMNHEAFL